jgi:predicted enzyme related to lactoylglutathione lyase
MYKYVKFTELPVANQDRALKFYAEKVGLAVASDNPYQQDWRWIELEIPGARTRILLSRRSDESMTDSPSLLLVTDDVKAAYEELKSKEVEFTQEPMQAPWNPQQTFALFRDSEGNLVMISSE